MFGIRPTAAAMLIAHCLPQALSHDHGQNTIDVITSSPLPAVVLFEPPDCSSCAFLWKRLSKLRAENIWHVNCTEHQSACIERAVGGDRSGVGRSRAVFAAPRPHPTIQAWTGSKWVPFVRGVDLNLISRFVSAAFSDSSEAQLWEAAGFGDAAALPTQPPPGAPEAVLPAQPPPPAPEADLPAPERSWGDGVVHRLTEANWNSFAKDDFVLLRIDPPGCRVDGGSCGRLDALWGLV